MRALHMFIPEVSVAGCFRASPALKTGCLSLATSFFLQDKGQVRDSLVLLFPSKASWTCSSGELQWQLSTENGLPKHYWTLYHQSRRERSRINLIRFLWYENSCGGNKPLLVKTQSVKRSDWFPPLTFWLGNFVTSVSNKDIQLYSTYSLKSRVTNSFII